MVIEQKEGRLKGGRTNFLSDVNPREYLRKQERMTLMFEGLRRCVNEPGEGDNANGR